MLLRKFINGKITNNICHQFFSQIRLKGNWHLEQMKERTVLKLKGEQCAEFLQGLVTNDIKILNSQKAMYAMFLNIRGRILFDTIIYKTDCTNTFFLECDKACLGDVERHLKQYKVRRKIDISSSENSVWAIFKPNIQGDHDFKIELSEKCIICPDPRLSELGYRAIVPQDADLVNVAAEGKETDFKMFRYKLGIPEGKEEFPIGKCFPLEMNCDYLNGVSFNKGCYIGQELTARTYHTGVVRKRLMPLEFQSVPENVSLDDPIIDSSNLKSSTIGKLRGIIGNLGLGLMRVSETLSSTNLKLGNISTKCSKPPWWPAESEQYASNKFS
ncbi:putative transferase CAF17 homolog, mitochondrial [Rhodnius prolixus]